MQIAASHLHCATCDATTLHTVRGCCHHQAQITTQPQPKAPRGKARSHGGGRGGRPRHLDLTDREKLVAQLLATGITQKQIADQLGILRSGISSVVCRARARIGVKHTYELLRYIRGQV